MPVEKSPWFLPTELKSLKKKKFVNLVDNLRDSYFENHLTVGDICKKRAKERGREGMNRKNFFFL